MGLKGISWCLLALLTVRASAETLKYDNLDYSSVGNWASIPGSGFNYKTKEFTGYDCVEGTTLQTGRPESNLDFSLTLDNESLKKELGVSADAKTMMGTGELSGAAKFMKASTEDSTSITLNYVGSIHFANEYFKQTGLSAVGKQYAALDDQVDDTCGQGFVKQIVRGAKLFFSIRFDFSSRDDKDAFSTELHYKSPMSSINLEVHNNHESLSKRARVTVSAYQLGGQVEKLAFIFKKAPAAAKPVTDQTGTTTARYSAIECSFGNMMDCKQALADALAYATDETNPASFPNQINSTPTPAAGQMHTQDLLANLSYLIVPYHFPEMIKIKGMDSAVEEQKQQLYRMLSENVDNLYQIQNLEHGIIVYTADQQDDFTLSEAILRKRQSAIIETAIYCYRQNQELCGGKLADLVDKLKTMPFNVQVLSPQPVTFGQFCNSTHATKPKYVDLGLRESVLAIEQMANDPLRPWRAALDKLGYFKDDQDAIDRCALLDRYLLTLTNLDLSYSGEATKISSLEVIRNLTQLQRLTVRQQNLRAIDRVQDFHDLQGLDLEGNAIREVGPLSHLSDLKTLRLAGNVVRSVDSLKGLPSLTLLDLRKNAPGLECFTTETLTQCLLARSKWRVEFTNVSNTAAMDLVFGRVTEMPTGFVLTGARTQYRGNYVVALQDVDNQAEGFSVHPGTLQSARFWNADVAVDADHVLITGGWPFYSLNSMELYDARAGFVSGSGALIDGRAGHTATVLKNGLVLVAGGYDSPTKLSTDSALSTAELIDPRAPGGPKIVQRLEMKSARAGHTATLLDDGRVLLIGGYVGGRGLRSLEVFRPDSRTFELVGNLVQGRGLHSTLRLADGTYLVVGGFRDGVTAADRGELIDAQTLKSRLTKGALNQGRGLHSAQVLSNGEVLIAGGLTKPRGDAVRADGLDLIQMLSTSFNFTKEGDGFAHCQLCLSTTEIYLPQEESFVSNPEPLNRPRAGMALIPIRNGGGANAFRLWGGLDQDSSSTLETGVVSEDPL